MSEYREEDIITYLQNSLNDEFNFKNCTRVQDKMAIKGILDLYQKEKWNNNKLTSLFYDIRNELKRLLISYDGEYYRPIKNTTKQEVYSSYFKLRTMLKGEYCFKDNKTALDELLEGKVGENNASTEQMY